MLPTVRCVVSASSLRRARSCSCCSARIFASSLRSASASSRPRAARRSMRPENTAAARLTTRHAIKR